MSAYGSSGSGGQRGGGFQRGGGGDRGAHRGGGGDGGGHHGQGGGGFQRGGRGDRGGQRGGGAGAGGYRGGAGGGGGGYGDGGYQRGDGNAPTPFDQRDPYERGSSRGRPLLGGNGGDRGGPRRDAPIQIPIEYPPLPISVPIPEGARVLNIPDLGVNGTLGERFVCTTNHHVVKCLPTKAIWQYKITITIPASSRHKGSDLATMQQRARVLLKREVLDFWGDYYVFDGVSLLWSPNLIFPEGEKRELIVSMEKRRDNLPNDIAIIMEHAGKLNVAALAKYMMAGQIELNPAGNPVLEPTIKWLQAAFRKDPAARLVTRPNSNAYFDTKSSGPTVFPLRSTAGVLEARRGVFQTMQIRFGKITMNIDTATTPFWVARVSLIDFAAALMGCKVNDLTQRARANTNAFISQCGKMRGIYFNVRHLGEKANSIKLKMKGFTRANADNTTFEEKSDDGSTATTSVSAYFERKYNIKLHYPMLPLVNTAKGDFPLELCFSAEGERYKELLQGSETADFIKFATAPAHGRRSQIDHSLRMLAHHQNATLTAHGLAMEPHGMQVKARMLPNPRLVYGGGRNMSPVDGKWNLRGLQFLKPAAIKSWAMLYLPNRASLDERALGNFGGELMKMFRTCGMRVPSQPPVVLIDNPNGGMERSIDQVASMAQRTFQAPPDVIFFVVQGAPIPQYQVIKMGMDIHKGIASQVMTQEKAFSGRGTPQYCANIAMKVNVKLGGTNTIAAEKIFTSGRCMLLGGDISHAAPGALRSANPPPSCAALVGTWDRECTAYTAVTAMQESTQGMIANIKPMFTELLKRYTEKNNRLYPQHIFFYRDGVSESEFDAIKKEEGKPLKDLCRELGFDPKITLIVAIKRHHTRFFADKFATKHGNVPCGTVIENSTTRNDAFIIAHPDLQGTKRPTRYVTLVDENKLTADDFQRLTNNLCSSYARATTSVAVCPPIYYADQACERARLHLQQRGDKMVLGPVHNNLRWNMWWQ